MVRGSPLKWLRPKVQRIALVPLNKVTLDAATGETSLQTQRIYRDRFNSCCNYPKVQHNNLFTGLWDIEVTFTRY